MPGPMTDAVTAYFAREDWPVAEGAPGVFETAFEGSDGMWPCRLHVFEEDVRMVFVSAFPLPIEDLHRAAIGEFCHRANFGLAIGNFELDYDGGELRFRTSVDAEGTAPTADLVRNAVEANVLTMNRYYAGIEAVLAGTNPTDAVEDCEE